MKKLYVDDKKQFWLKSLQEEDGTWCFERMADVSSDYNLPKMFVLEEQCEFFTETNKEEVSKLKEFDKGYSGLTYPSGEGGGCWRWVKSKEVKVLLEKEFKQCNTFKEMKKFVKKYGFLVEYL
ncbi:MAG: hypothetical protein NC222_06640 [Staphylococcus sp.]|nr:hypothetical protein [Staphylococcus sp.]